MSSSQCDPRCEECGCLECRCHEPAPLTDAQIAACLLEVDDPKAFGRMADRFGMLQQFARAIEAAHGIRSKK